MDNNISLIIEPIMRSINFRVILVQVFVTLFLCINSMMISTFFMKDFFYRAMRYILFANTLLSDCLILIITNFLLIFDYFHFTIQMWVCAIICLLSSVYILVTPFTLMAMTVERYVAICMPLHHGELCTTHSSLQCILVIHVLSCVPATALLLIIFASASLSFYTQYKVCSVEMFLIHSWQSHLLSAINQFYFLSMFSIIVFSYVKIMKVAKVASGENKKSSGKALRTVLLHAFQLLLCLIQLWCPLIETAVLQIDVMLFINVRYFNYITFYLAPRCLSPLIYGLRDEKFFLALKYYALCGFYKNIVFHLTN